MSIKLINSRLSSAIVFLKRSKIDQARFDLGKEMKMLNDNKQFEKALQLFDEHTKSNIKTCPSFTITQALKACANIGDLQRGSTIHQLVSDRIDSDCFISASLIHLYSESGKAFVLF